MKKLLLLMAVCLLFTSVSDARDYAKLQAKEIKHAQKYGTTNKILNKSYAPAVVNVSNIKDPKLIKIGNYQDISKAKYEAKIAKDNVNYAKINKNFASSRTDNYHRQAYADDFYRIYNICEKIIRANNLEFIDWRITVQPKQDFNAYSSYMNNITIYTGLYDSFVGNDDAMAFIIGHEMGHALLGHQARTERLANKVNRSIRVNSPIAYLYSRQRYLIESKNMEFAADAEGAKLIARAGFDLSKAREAINFMNSFDSNTDQWRKTHPNSEKRLENFDENIKYFPLDEWVKQGKYNIYNSEVLPCQRSSDRKSIVIKRSDTKSDNEFYRPETLEDLYKRYGYMSYLHGEFNNSVKYFKKALDENKSDYAVYLYISYAYDYLGQKDLAKEFADYAQRLAPDNKYVKKQIQAL